MLKICTIVGTLLFTVNTIETSPIVSVLIRVYGQYFSQAITSVIFPLSHMQTFP
ncbi:MAG: hypothetical protein ACOC31_03640 [Bacteroidota bacterium]